MANVPNDWKLGDLEFSNKRKMEDLYNKTKSNATEIETIGDVVDVNSENLYYKAGDTVEISSLCIAGVISYESKRYQGYLTLPKSLKNINTVSIVHMLGPIATIIGTADGTGNNIEIADVENTTLEVVVQTTNSIRIRADKTTGVYKAGGTNVLTNTPACFFGTITLSFQ